MPTDPASVSFDRFDYGVVEAHGIASGATEDNGASCASIRTVDPSIPVQRLVGLCRRGLMRREDNRYFLTSKGAKAAHAYRDREAA